MIERFEGNNDVKTSAAKEALDFISFLRTVCKDFRCWALRQIGLIWADPIWVDVLYVDVGLQMCAKQRHLASHHFSRIEAMRVLATHAIVTPNRPRA